MPTLNIQYSFTLKDGDKEVFDLKLDGKTLILREPVTQNPPPWTRLEFQQCPHCPLTGDIYRHCPLAVNLVNIVKRFDRLISFDRIQVEVLTAERLISRNTSAQEGISSMMGLLIATSKCPFTDFFKPMARFHLPFANEQETVWRATATYLMAQYFLSLKGDRHNLDLEGLTKIYNDIEKLNAAIVRRLRAAVKEDSTVNALVHLDIFAKLLTPGLEESLNSLQNLIRPFLTTHKNCR
jgi:hypothetical protein